MIINNAQSLIATAIGRFIRISPKKVQRILRYIRGQSYKTALNFLEFMPYKSCEYIWQLIYSASENAVHNFRISKTCLIILEAIVNKGPILRRHNFRAQGRIFKIQKPTSHIKITVAVI
jgi:large subunit ribosomal protein L22